jgi:hypothetical protein
MPLHNLWICSIGFVVTLVSCDSKPKQAPEEARAGFVALLGGTEPTDINRYVFSKDEETIAILKDVIQRVKQKQTDPAPGLLAPQTGLMAALSKGIIKSDLPPVVGEQHNGDRLVQTYSTGKSMSFRLVDGYWKIDLDAREEGTPTWKERLRAMQMTPPPVPQDSAPNGHSEP